MKMYPPSYSTNSIVPYDPTDHDAGFANADQCGWLAFGLMAVMVLTLFIGIATPKRNKYDRSR